MKKTLIALAVLAASGASFAQVAITGTFDPSVAAANTSYANGTSASQNFVRNGSQGTTNITFSGAEDLGSGLKALFLYEADFSAAAQAGPTNTLGYGGGQIYTGLSGSFGTVKLGAPNTPSLYVQSERGPIATKLGSGFGGVLGGSHVRENNSVNYTSPEFMGGLTAAVNYSFGTSVDAAAGVTAANAKTDVGFMYKAGPLFAGISFYRQDGTNQQTNFAANYDFGPAKVYFGTHTETATVSGVDAQSSGNNFAVSAPVGPVVLLASVATLDDKSASNFDKTISAVGVTYALSKRTSVYARYVTETNDNTTGTSIKDVKTTLAGIQHNF